MFDAELVPGCFSAWWCLWHKARKWDELLRLISWQNCCFSFLFFFFLLNISWSSNAFTGSLFNNIARCPALERVAHWSHIKKTRQLKGSNHYFLASWNLKGGWTRRRNGILNRTDGWVWPSHERNKQKKNTVGIKSVGGYGFKNI